MKKGRIIFNVLSIIFILSLFIIYGYRLVHFYRLEHRVYEANEAILIDVLMDSKGIDGADEGLQKSESGYIYGSKSKNNYLYYAGRLWRIVSIDENNNIKLITDDMQTILGVNDNNYDGSNIYNWLNVTDEANSGVFEKSLKGVTLTDKVSLLDMKEYSLLTENNYLSNLTPYLITNEGKLSYVDSKGVHDDVNGVYGIRPVITIPGNTLYISGNGNLDVPYIINGNVSSKVSDLYVGEYVKYNDYLWRVIGYNDNSIRLVMDGTIDVNDQFSIDNHYNINAGIGYYLNNDFLNSLENNDYIVSSVFNTGNYIPTAYNYLDTYSSSVEAKVGMLSIGDFYINEYENIYTITYYSRTKNTIYVINNNRKFYADLYTSSKYKVRPVINIDSTLEIKDGKGTKEFAYEIGR